MSLEGFIVQNEPKIAAKVAAFSAAGKEALHILLDFDRTVTMGQPGADDATTWQVLYQHLPKEGQEEYKKYYATYRPLELSGDMTEEDSKTWTSAILDLFVTHRVNLALVEENFLSVVMLRPGMKELFELCANNQIPIVVLSAGIRNVIDILLAAHSIQSTVTLSTELDVDKHDTITGWDKASLVHVFNKRESGHAVLGQIRTQRPYCLLVGDSLLDATMIDNQDKTIKIRIVDPRPGETTNLSLIKQETFSLFDLMIRDHTAMPIVQLIEFVISSSLVTTK